MKSSTQHALVCLLALVFALCVNCASPPKAPKAVKTVAFIPNNFSNFWKVARKGCEKADGELPDVSVAFKSVFGGTIVEQQRFVREALDTDGADAIAISPIDSTAEKQMINDAAKRAIVITQDSDAPDSDRVLYIGADNKAAGHQAGELIKKALPQGGKIMVFVGKREVQNAQERYAGLQEALQGSKVEIIDLMTDDTDPSRARDNAYQTLKKYPDIAGMVGLWSYNGPAILTALRPENMLGKIKIVCFDDERETLEGIRAGVIYGTVAQQPFEYGYQAVVAAGKILHGDRSVIPADKKLLIPTTVITRENVVEYTDKINKLLGNPSK